jgi:hypothetical protein
MLIGWKSTVSLGQYITDAVPINYYYSLVLINFVYHGL